MKLWRLAWRNLWRNRLRSGIVLLAMMFGISALLLMAGFMQAMIDNMVANAIDLNLGHAQIHRRAFIENQELQQVLADTPTWQQRLHAEPDVQAFTPRLLVDGMANSAASNQGVQIVGIHPQQEQSVTRIQDYLVAGAYLSATPGAALLSARLVDKLKLRLGSKLVLTFADRSGQVTGAAFRISGVFRTPSSAFDDSRVFVRQADLARFSGQNGAHEIAIRIRADANADWLARLQSLAAADEQVRAWGEIQPLLASSAESIQVSNALLLSIVMLALGFGITNVMLMAVFERSREFAVMLAVGMRRARLLMLILLESLLLAAVGAGGGLLLGGLLLALLGHSGISLAMFAQGLAGFGVSSTLYPHVEPRLFAEVALLMLFTALLSGLYPARYLLRQNLAERLAAR